MRESAVGGICGGRRCWDFLEATREAASPFLVVYFTIKNLLQDDGSAALRKGKTGFDVNKGNLALHKYRTKKALPSMQYFTLSS
jgi:hypothetical protein